MARGSAHLNHQLRPTADRDEQFCRELAVTLGLPIVVGRQPTSKAMRPSQRLSIEDAARRLRYDFLERGRGRHAAPTGLRSAIPEDDQAETFLLKLMRGAGLTGLGGIYPRRERGRPAAARRVARRAAGLPARRGASRGWRTRRTPTSTIRAIGSGTGCCPSWMRAYGADQRPAIARAAGLAREDGQWLDELAEARYCELADVDDDGVTDRRAAAGGRARRRFAAGCCSRRCATPGWRARRSAWNTSRPGSRRADGSCRRSRCSGRPAWNFGAENWSYYSRSWLTRPEVITLDGSLARLVQGRLVLNSTLKSLVFWMVLVVIGGLGVELFRPGFQTGRQADDLQRVHELRSTPARLPGVTITGNEITGTDQGQRQLPHLSRRRSTRAGATS